MVLSVLAGCVVTVFAGRSVNVSLGPGAGEWELGEPATVGLSAAALARATDVVASTAPVRYCTAVVVDGRIIHEDIHANTSSTQYESDSLGKTAIAEVIGVAVHQGLIDLDKPLMSYGLPPDCNRIPLAGVDPEALSVCAAQYTPFCNNGMCDNNVSHCLDILRIANKTQPGVFSGDCGRGKFFPGRYNGYGDPPSYASAFCMLRDPGACWVDPKTGDDYYKVVTARHILSQASGVGMAPPGTAFTYDSNVYISHLSYLLHKVTGEPPVEWATRNYAVPLGMPDFFSYDGFGEEISAGGGQMMSCRDALRVGQLMLNKGKWPNPNGGEPMQLIDESYVNTMLSPSFPASAPSYGLLTWLNRKAGAEDCCAPRWECAEAGNEQLPEGTSLLDDDLAPSGVPLSTGLGLGMFAKFMYIFPESNMAVVSLGLSSGATAVCPSGSFNYPNGTPSIGFGYDEGFTSSVIIRAMLPAIAGAIIDTSHAAMSSHAANTTVPKHHAPPMAVDHQQQQPHRRRNSLGYTHRHSQPRAQMEDVDASSVGSCSCTCPIHNGFGFCFDVDPAPNGTLDQCESVYDRATTCPAIGIPFECPIPGTIDEHCASIQMDGMRCTAQRDCAPITPPLNSTTSPFETGSCICWPIKFARSACTYADGSCNYTPFFPPPSA